MPSPRTKPQPLSDSEIHQIASEIAAGRPPMVWFTAAAVGVPEGRSGKVISLGDPADGDFLQVRPTGSKDVLSFSPIEVTLNKPPRPAAAGAAAPKPTTRKETTVPESSTVSSTVTPPAQAAPVSRNSAAGTGESTVKQTAASGAVKQAAAASPAKAVKAPAARKPKAPEVTISLTGTGDGEWTVDVVNGKKRTLRGLPVASSAVAQAAKLLHPEVADVVSGILEAARGAQEAKVQQLQAELEAAKRLLDELRD